MSEWRVGPKVPINVYEGDRPICQCHTAIDAKRIVEAVKDLGNYILVYNSHNFALLSSGRLKPNRNFGNSRRAYEHSNDLRRARSTLQGNQRCRASALSSSMTGAVSLSGGLQIV